MASTKLIVVGSQVSIVEMLGFNRCRSVQVSLDYLTLIFLGELINICVDNAIMVHEKIFENPN